MAERIKLSPEEKQKEQAERDRRREVADIKTVLKTPEGRRLIRRIMVEKGGLFLTSYTSEVNSTMFNEGSRSIATWLFLEITRADPNAYNQISQEYDSEQESRLRIEDLERKADPAILT